MPDNTQRCRWRSKWSAAEPDGHGSDVLLVSGTRIFAEVSEVLAMRFFTAPPDWRKIAFLLTGVLGLFLLC